MNIETQVRTLQTRVRQLMALLALIVIGGAIVGTYYSGAPQAEAYGNRAPKVVKAQKYVVVDGAGREVAAFGNIDGDTALVMKHRSASIVVGTTNKEAGLYVYDNKGNTRVGASYIPGNDQGMMAIGDDNGDMEWVAPN